MNHQKDLMKNRECRGLSALRNKLIKQINFAEQRIEKYGNTMSETSIKSLTQRIEKASAELADINDKIADIENSVNKPVLWKGRVSEALYKAYKKARNANQ